MYNFSKRPETGVLSAKAESFSTWTTNVLCVWILLTEPPKIFQYSKIYLLCWKAQCHSEHSEESRCFCGDKEILHFALLHSEWQFPPVFNRAKSINYGMRSTTGKNPESCNISIKCRAMKIHINHIPFVKLFPKASAFIWYCAPLLYSDSLGRNRGVRLT